MTIKWRFGQPQVWRFKTTLAGPGALGSHRRLGKVRLALRKNGQLKTCRVIMLEPAEVAGGTEEEERGVTNRSSLLRMESAEKAERLMWTSSSCSCRYWKWVVGMFLSIREGQLFFFMGPHGKQKILQTIAQS